MTKESEFINNVMRAMEVADSIVKDIREDAEAGHFMSPAQQLVVANMIESHGTFIRRLAESVVRYEEALNG